MNNFISFMEARHFAPWEGTASELKKESGWAKSPNWITRTLRLSAPALLAVGIAVAFSRTKSRRTIRLRKVAADTVIDESLHRHQSESGDDTNAPTVTDEINNTASADSSAISDAIEKISQAYLKKIARDQSLPAFYRTGSPTATQ